MVDRSSAEKATESYLVLSREDRLTALGVAATASGRPVHLLEKDIWVVWALEGLFQSALGEHLVFKGGTSLSKGYGIIQRFSEDVDVTYDVRQIIPELVTGDPPVPANNSQAKKWTDTARARLPEWVKDTALPVLEEHARRTGADVAFRVENDVIYVDYDQLAQGSNYVAPYVKLEFGARSTGEPAERRVVTCDAEPLVAGVVFPKANPRIMLPKRTFWEKATAVHVFCLQGVKGDRLSRHWHDLIRLDDAGIADQAIEDTALAHEVADWKTKFFRARDKEGNPIDYQAAVTGGLLLAPEGEIRKELAVDYQKMADEGMLPEGAETFDQLMERCAQLQHRANNRDNK